MVDEFLAHELNSAGYGGVEIRKVSMKTEVIIRASRPGVVIGRRGAKIRELTDILESDFGIEKAQIEVSEIESPWLDAKVMASRLARQLERGVRFRRMAYWILRRVMRAGALGCEIIVSGKLSSRRARYQKFKQGTIAKTGQPSLIFVDQAYDIAILKPGVIGIKVRIMKPDAKLPGVVHIKKPAPQKAKQPIQVHVEEEVEEEITEEIEEKLEGITDIEELRELEELDDLETIDEVDEVETPSTEEKQSPEEPTEEEPKKVDESSEDNLSELDELDNLDQEE